MEGLKVKERGGLENIKIKIQEIIINIRTRVEQSSNDVENIIFLLTEYLKNKTKTIIERNDGLIFDGIELGGDPDMCSLNCRLLLEKLGLEGINRGHAVDLYNKFSQQNGIIARENLIMYLETFEGNLIDLGMEINKNDIPLNEIYEGRHRALFGRGKKGWFVLDASYEPFIHNLEGWLWRTKYQNFTKINEYSIQQETLDKIRLT